MKDDAVVIATLGQGDEVLRCLGRVCFKQLETYRAFVGFNYRGAICHVFSLSSSESHRGTETQRKIKSRRQEAARKRRLSARFLCSRWCRPLFSITFAAFCSLPTTYRSLCASVAVSRMNLSIATATPSSSFDAVECRPSISRSQGWALPITTPVPSSR